MRLNLNHALLVAPLLDHAARPHTHMSRAGVENAPKLRNLPNTLEGIYSNGRCMDLMDATFQDGQPVQMWTCFGGPNQRWQFNQGRVQTGANQCLDVPDGHRANGVRLQSWTCTEGNTNQAFEKVGNALRWVGQDMCVDITDGAMADGTFLQMWECDPNNPNQAFAGATVAISASPSAAPSPTRVPAPSPTPSTAAPTSASPADISPIIGKFGGLNLIDFDDFIACHEALAPHAQNLADAGASQNLPPILLGAIVLETSDGKPSIMPGGLAGLDAAGLWATYGQGTQIDAARDNLFAAARYLAALLQRHNQDVLAALHTYGGARPQFVETIAEWMAGAAD